MINYRHNDNNIYLYKWLPYSQKISRALISRISRFFVNLENFILEFFRIPVAKNLVKSWFLVALNKSGLAT